MTKTYNRDELVARLVRAGELEVSGEHPTKSTTTSPQGLSSMGPAASNRTTRGYTNYFASLRAAFEDRSIRRGITVIKGDTDRLPDLDRGDVRTRIHAVTGGDPAAQRPPGRLGPIQHLRLR